MCPSFLLTPLLSFLVGALQNRREAIETKLKVLDEKLARQQISEETKFKVLCVCVCVCVCVRGCVCNMFLCGLFPPPCLLVHF